MRVLKKRKNKEFKEIYILDNGIVIKIPKYKKTSFYMGCKKDAEANGFKVKGTNRFYKISNGQIVIDGYIAQEREDIEIILSGDIRLNKESVKGLHSFVINILNRQNNPSN